MICSVAIWAQDFRGPKWLEPNGLGIWIPPLGIPIPCEDLLRPLAVAARPPAPTSAVMDPTLIQ